MTSKDNENKIADFKYEEEIRVFLRATGMTEEQINQEEKELTEHQNQILNGRIELVEPSPNLQAKFDSSRLYRLGERPDSITKIHRSEKGVSVIISRLSEESWFGNFGHQG